jgi:hypothetical protein
VAAGLALYFVPAASESLALPATSSVMGNAGLPAIMASIPAHRGGDLVRDLRPGPMSATQYSSNWSGYVGNQGNYKHVSASWRVPTVRPTADNRYSSTWVGIGGDPSPDLVQGGTESDSINGTPVYYAWTEILPETEKVAFAVRAGDLIHADVYKSSPTGNWIIQVIDRSTGQGVTRSTPYASTKLTAEWIHEAVTVNGRIANLTVTSNAVFDNAYANGLPARSAGKVDIIYMADKNNNLVAVPGGFDSEGDGFQVAYGNRVPPPPAS